MTAILTSPYSIDELLQTLIQTYPSIIFISRIFHRCDAHAQFSAIDFPIAAAEKPRKTANTAVVPSPSGANPFSQRRAFISYNLEKKKIEEKQIPMYKFAETTVNLYLFLITTAKLSLFTRSNAGNVLACCVCPHNCRGMDEILS